MKKIETQIPIYRAKKIDSNEYVEGYYSDSMKLDRIMFKNGDFITTEARNGEYRKGSVKTFAIDPSTLAIHFSGMNDKNGVKIFAGLRVNNAPDRKCGDLVKLGQHKGRVVETRGEIFVNSGDSYAFYQNHKDGFISKFEWEDLEVTGIQD